MQLIEDLNGFPAELTGCSLALGNFDGVHLGHQALLAASQAFDGPRGVLTFDPHPRSLFRPDVPIFPLTPGALKAEALAECGIDFLWTARFDTALSQLSAEDFVVRYLVETAQARQVIAGFNFYFGKGRGGSPDVLRELGKAYGFDVQIIDPREQDGRAVSSSSIRADLQMGRVQAAREKLGRDWIVRGTVISGAQLGTGLGFPTANIALHPEQDLHHGIYAVRVGVGDAFYRGAAYFGKRPTFDNGKPVLEVFLFDFDGNLYGQDIDVHFVSFIREDEAFEDGHDLAEQMQRDCDAAEAALAARD